MAGETHDAPPLSDERLAEISARAKNIWKIRAVGPRNLSDLERGQLQAIAVAYADDVSDLLAEVEQLRVENAAMRAAIIDCPAFMEVSADCPWCDEFHESYAHKDPRPTHPHAPDCPVTKARVLLADEEH